MQAGGDKLKSLAYRLAKLGYVVSFNYSMEFGRENFRTALV